MRGNKGKDYYAILGVPRDADEAALKKAYRALAMKHHPDRGGSTEKFQEISEAYDVLNDPKKRQIYDQFGEEGLKGGMGGTGGYQFDPSMFAHLFEDIFGGTGMRFSFGPGGFGFGDDMRRRPARKPPAQEVEIGVTLEQLFAGGLKTVNVTRRVNGRDETKTFQIEIKAGWGQKVMVTYDNAGDQEPGQLPADLTFVIKAKPHDIWQREGADLITEEVISLKQALTGVQVTRRGIDGEPVVLSTDGRIVSPGADFRVRERGMPKKGGGRGDAVFRFKIAFPTWLSKEARDAMQRYLPEE